ncbi:MAG: hypothetical protein JW809_06050 [Pirellulales bacterium]|nr:hypothetical protein [Pirellulales bacterium]
MRSALFVLFAAVVATGLSGCARDRCMSPHGRCLIDGSCGHCDDCPETCQACPTDCCEECGGRGCRLCCGRPAVDPGPASAAITYPYYTTRGPRDFLARNPRSIGP